MSNGVHCFVPLTENSKSNEKNVSIFNFHIFDSILFVAGVCVCVCIVQCLFVLQMPNEFVVICRGQNAFDTFLYRTYSVYDLYVCWLQRRRKKK